MLIVKVLLLCYNPNINTQAHNFDVIVIGGGASGMMAAGVASARGKKVLLIEKNSNLGEKLNITGGGRCNITNAEYDVRELLKHYGKAEHFLYSSFSQFGVKDTFKFFESKGLPLVIQARKRAFPHTEKSKDVCNIMKKFIKDGGVDVRTGSTVKKILIEKGKIVGISVGTKVFTANSYILATGGMSHPETGSTGDGFSWLGGIGHKVKESTPTIVPIATKEAWSKVLSGTSLSFMKITFFADGKKAFNKKGKILFTHFGLSGPLILNSSSAIADLIQGDSIVTATIDAYPDTEINDLEERVIKVFDSNKNKKLKNILPLVVPAGMAPGIEILMKAIDFDKKVHSVTKEECKILVNVLKSLPLTIDHLMGYDRAVVADGGVILEEIDTKSMKSKIYDNLYITGDLLNINRPSGGYSLQLCWTTGYVAGISA